MQSLTLAYRDDDRTPVISPTARWRRNHGLHVRIVRIKDGEMPAGLFNARRTSSSVHLEYLYDARAGENRFLRAEPRRRIGPIVRPNVQSVEEFRGRRWRCVRTANRMRLAWLRKLGLERDVETIIVHDKDVGRWGQWKKVVSGDCVAAFMSPLYLPDALNAGLKVLPAPEIPIVGHFAQACLAEFPRNHDAAMRAYVKSVLHALVWLTLRPDEAFAAVEADVATAMVLFDQAKLRPLRLCGRWLEYPALSLPSDLETPLKLR
jgi:hypothetical protein